MKIAYDSNDIILIEGAYYTPSFNILKDLLTIQIVTNGASTVTVQSSIDGSDWFDVPSCSFVTGLTGGLQSYVECQPEVLYRIKSTLLPSKIILLM